MMKKEVLQTQRCIEKSRLAAKRFTKRIDGKEEKR